MKHSIGPARLRDSIRRLERCLGMLDDKRLSCCGISLAQCQALVEVGRAGQISLNELAHLLDLENSTISRTVNNLVNSDLLRRDVDQHDRRYVSISLNDSGQKVFGELEEAMSRYFKNVFNAIPEDKREQVLESLRILLEAFEKSNCE